MVDAAPDDLQVAAMIRAIIGIAQELDIEVIAQGVESEAQRAFLTSVAAKTRAQGYYYSKPVPADRATGLLRDSLIRPDQLPQLLWAVGQRSLGPVINWPVSGGGRPPRTALIATLNCQSASGDRGSFPARRFFH